MPPRRADRNILLMNFPSSAREPSTSKTSTYSLLYVSMSTTRLGHLGFLLHANPMCACRNREEEG